MQESEKLVKLLEDSISLYKKDRDMAIKNYNDLKQQLNQATQAIDYTEDGVLEKEVNKALENVFKSGIRLDNVIQTLSKILMTSMNNNARVESAKAFSGLLTNEKIVDKPIDITRLLSETTESVD